MNNRILAKQLLLSSNFWIINKSLLRLVGLEAAFLLSSFAEAETMLADKEGWFYQTIKKTEEITTLSRHKQDKAIELLIEKSLLEQKTKGMPRKRYFKINYENLANLLVKNSHTSMRKIDKLECEKSATSKEHIYKELNKEKTTISRDEFSKLTKLYQKCGFKVNAFTPEWIEEILKEYGYEWSKQALLTAEKAGKISKNYVEGILQNWNRNGGMQLEKKKDKKEQLNWRGSDKWL